MNWDDKARAWDADPGVRAYSTAAYASLVQALTDEGAGLAGMRVLDFGCGTGLLTAAMASEAEDVMGFDVSPAMVEVLREKDVGNIVARSGDLSELPTGFDLVTCSSVMAFVDDYPETVRQLVERLAPGGRFVQWDWELDPTDEEPYGLTREAIRGALEAAGLVDLVVRTGFEQAYEGMTMAPVMGMGRRVS